MPFFIIILIALLIAQIGFWNTLGAILGAFAMIVLLIAIAGATLVLGVMWLVGRATGPEQRY